ncbi:hypothetical protein KDL01_24930, partial [Actinospica durhamensis]
ASAPAPGTGRPFIPGITTFTPAQTQSSTNWAGYAATGGKYTSVSASWVQPTVQCTANGIVAFWVGLDGWGSSSVEQDGTAADCSTGTPSYYAWWETYPQNAMQDYADAVAPGDALTSTVTSLGSGMYELDLDDTTKGWSEHHKVSAPGAVDASAEIIAEAVSEGDAVSALPDFDAVNFTGSRVDKAAPQQAGAQPIDMTGTSGAIVAATGAIDQAGDFAVAYQNTSGLLRVGVQPAGFGGGRHGRAAPRPIF